MKLHDIALCAIAAALLHATSALAASCTLSATPSVSFPAYDVASATDTTAAPVITSTCTGNPTEDISIGASSVSGSMTNRQMKLTTGTDTLNYNLYKDSGYTQVWGTSAAGTSLKIASAKSTQTTTIYAKIPAGQDVTIGSYSDSVTVTLSP